jgi:hypothetical protein
VPGLEFHFLQTTRITIQILFTLTNKTFYGKRTF